MIDRHRAQQSALFSARRQRRISAHSSSASLLLIDCRAVPLRVACSFLFARLR
jgi:hypothetical protein